MRGLLLHHLLLLPLLDRVESLFWLGMMGIRVLHLRRETKINRRA